MRTSTLTRRLLLLIALFASAGIGHFVMTDAFVGIVPSWVPAPRMMVYLSGVAELAGALGLLLPATRAAAGWGLIAMLLAVFPANINMLQMARETHASLGYELLMWMRLPLQPLLIWLVWNAAVKPAFQSDTTVAAL